MIKRTGFKMAGMLPALAIGALILAMVALIAGCHHDPRSIRIDNAGAEGFDSPQELTDSQKQRIVEIILESPEAKEKPPTESIYHISMFWTAFIWDDSGYSYMSSVNFENWEDDPGYKAIPESARWYPGANLYYGDPQAPTAEWMIEAKVDLNAEKIVYINSMPYHAAPLIPPAPREQPPSEISPSGSPGSTETYKEPYPGNHGITTTRVEPKPGDNVTTSSALMIRLTLDDLIEKSDTIVIGKVVDIFPSRSGTEPLWSSYLKIFTDVIIQTESYLYGEPQSAYIAVRVMGGSVDNITMWVEDEPVFNLGEEAVLFLSKTAQHNIPPEGFESANYYTVTGSFQGKLGYKDGHMITPEGNIVTISELERKIAEVREAEGGN
jgi:hypothetical protein